MQTQSHGLESIRVPTGNAQERIRMRILCQGVVQGVGFRPTVHTHATGLGLSGWVCNSPEGAVVEVEGPGDVVQEFVRSLPRVLPRLARLQGMEVIQIPTKGELGFEIKETRPGARTSAMVPPDTALCEDCRREMEAPQNRRFHYPFITCTHCGPRFSITLSLPYDRQTTSMACFEMCADCKREYRDPKDRRFHAETICCPSCGPKLWLVDKQGNAFATDHKALTAARDILSRGFVLALKGIGGFHIACRCDQRAPIQALRAKKRRMTKPFALMVRDISVAEALVHLREEDRDLMLSPCSPIVLAPKKGSRMVSEEVAPGVGDLGVMLPTTPLHLELFRNAPYEALIMTSGNTGGDPICKGNREALSRLAGVVDFFLLHDRDIARRVDDSVVRSTSYGPVLVRRSRGFVPSPLPMPVRVKNPLLAMGAFLQNTVAIGLGQEVFLSQHIGDLETEGTRGFLVEAIEGLEDFLSARPKEIVVDCHPDYPSTWLGHELARRRQGKVLMIQHHIAHAASVLAEHGRFPTAREIAGALVLDGTGLGIDGTLWGGEVFLTWGGLKWKRVGRLRPLPLIGGQKAIKEPWRIAMAGLLLAGTEQYIRGLPLGEWVPGVLLSSMGLSSLETWPRSSGCGRVMEAAGAIVGLAKENHYEGELACLLEALAGNEAREAEVWEEAIGFIPGEAELDTARLLSHLAKRCLEGEDPRWLAASFHKTLARGLGELAEHVLGGKASVIALGGGCLVNRHLRRYLRLELEKRGFEVLLPFKVPPGDGGISYGQAVLGGVQLAALEPLRLKDRI